MKTIDTVVKIVVLACALVTLGAVFVWAPPCTGTLELTNGNMVPMKCHWTARACALIALVMAAVSVVGLISRKPVDGLFTVAVVGLGLGLILMTFNTPISIGICASEDMACHTTAAWLRICGGIALVAPWFALISRGQKHQVKSI